MGILFVYSRGKNKKILINQNKQIRNRKELGSSMKTTEDPAEPQKLFYVEVGGGGDQICSAFCINRLTYTRFVHR